MEEKRGCGWRKVGGAYLVGSGLAFPCDALPLDLEPCGECGYTVPFSRGIQEIRLGYLASKVERAHKRSLKGECEEPVYENMPPCPVCTLGLPGKVFVMYVSQEYYSTESFITEARRMGVSKRIAPQCLPKDFRIGTSWIFLAHKKTPFYTAKKVEVDVGDITGSPGEKQNGLSYEPTYKPGIFYAFRPQRVEILLWKGQKKVMQILKEILEWEKKGFTVVLIDPTEENMKKHGGRLVKASRREKQ